MNVTQILKIARREYLARVRSRAFIFMTVMIPAFLAAYMFVLPALFSSTGADTLRVALLDAGTGLTDALADRLAGIDRPSIEVTERVAVPDDSDATRARFSEAVRQETRAARNLRIGQARRRRGRPPPGNPKRRARLHQIPRASAYPYPLVWAAPNPLTLAQARSVRMVQFRDTSL